MFITENQHVMSSSLKTVTPYKNDKRKSEQVESMFDNIAPAYDRLNHTLSLGIDKYWRKKAIGWLISSHPETILDIATGTGDFALQAYHTLQPDSITGVDISEGMMEIGREKISRLHLEDKISFRKEDCLSLSFNDESFDAITVAFGIRNFEDIDAGLKEMYRVLKKSGRLVILELSTPQQFPMKQLYSIYSKSIIPTLGKMISKDDKAYHYLPESIKAFPQGKEITNKLKQTGFTEATYTSLTFGICTLYKAIK